VVVQGHSILIVSLPAARVVEDQARLHLDLMGWVRGSKELLLYPLALHGAVMVLE